MKRRILPTLIAVAGMGVGCVSIPEAPPEPEDLSALAARYDNPTAVVPEARIRDIIALAAPILSLIQVLDQLRFIKTLVSDTSAGLEDNSAAEEFDVQGAVLAAFPCPGDGPRPTANGMTNGFVRATFGVHESRLKRGFSGALEICRMRVVPIAGEAESVLLSGDIIADLGADLAIGDRLQTPLLAKVKDLTGAITGQASGARSELTRTEFDFRVTTDDSVETLVDLSDLSRGEMGTLLIGIRVDGAIYITDSMNTWTCAVGNQACTLDR